MKNIETDINFDNWKEETIPPGIAVCSGGMDSTAMGLYMLAIEQRPTIFCHINLKQKAEEGERQAIKNIVNHLKKEGYNTGYFFVDTPWLGELGASALTDENIPIPPGMDSLLESFNIKSNLENPGLWTPARNIVLLSVASALADRIHAKKITLGANQSETAYRDNTMDFLKAFELMARFGTLIMPEVTSPLYHLDKSQLLKWYIDYDFYDILQYLWSCDSGGDHMCGICGCCNNRQLAFHILNQDPYYAQYKDNQTYLNTEYFHTTFLPEAIARAKPGIWYEPYIDLLKKSME